MKIRTLALAGLAIALSACSALAAGSWDIVRGNGSVRLENREVAAFTGIEVAGSGLVRFTVGAVRQVTVETDANILPYIRTEVRGGTLVLGVEPGASIKPHAPGVPDHRARPALHRHRGFGRRPAGVADRRPTGSHVSIAGSGDVEGDVSADEVSVEIRGSGSVTLAGTAASGRFEIYGSGDIEVEDLAGQGRPGGHPRLGQRDAHGQPQPGRGHRGLGRRALPRRREGHGARRGLGRPGGVLRRRGPVNIASGVSRAAPRRGRRSTAPRRGPSRRCCPGCPAPGRLPSVSPAAPATRSLPRCRGRPLACPVSLRHEQPLAYRLCTEAPFATPTHSTERERFVPVESTDRQAADTAAALHPHDREHGVVVLEKHRLSLRLGGEDVRDLDGVEHAVRRFAGKDVRDPDAVLIEGSVHVRDADPLHGRVVWRGCVPRCGRLRRRSRRSRCR